jgi:epoxide hydrolase-like predicted phosphatase
MTTNEKIRAIIWDLGGVLLRTEDLTYREKWEKKLGLEAWELADLVFRNEVSQLATVGKASVDDIWKSLQKELDLEYEESERLKNDFFAGDRMDERLISFIRHLRGPYKTGMITNAWPDIRHWIENEWKIADAFDHILISAEVGLVKPDPAIYNLCLQTLNVTPDEAIFIDDFIENIHGARAVGMHAIRFQNPEQVCKELKERLEITQI